MSEPPGAGEPQPHGGVTARLRHLLGTTDAARRARDRRALAASLESLADDVRPRAFDAGYLPAVIRADVAQACAAPAWELALILRDVRVPVDEELLQATRGFLEEARRSPLFGSDPAAARRSLAALRRRAAARIGRAAAA